MAEAAGLYYEEHGPADAPSLILSSGLGGSASYWAPNLAGLADHHRVIAYDHRGTGRSDRTVPAELSVADLADDLLVLIDALGVERASIVGHAAGGVAALALAAKAPERIERLVIVNGWAQADPHFLRCFAVRLALLRHAGVEAFLRAQPIFLYPANWLSAHTADLDADLPHQLAGFPGIETMEQRIAALAAFELGDPMALVARTLVVVAEDDMLVPSDAGRRLAALLPDAVVVTMDWGGHACNVTDPAGFDALVLAFLRS